MTLDEAFPIRLGLLGPLAVYNDRGAQVPLVGRLVPELLAKLALTTGQVVRVDELVTSLWGDEATVETSVEIHQLIIELRRQLEPVSDAIAVSALPGGYRLDASRLQIDTYRYLWHTERAEAAAKRGNSSTAETEGQAAQKLWRGELLEGLAAPFVPVAIAELDHLLGVGPPVLAVEIRSGGPT